MSLKNRYADDTDNDSIQFHVAFSSVINGCGTWAGIPYLCYTQLALNCMILPSAIREIALSM